MAVLTVREVEATEAFIDVANKLLATRVLWEQVLDFNTVLATDWTQYTDEELTAAGISLTGAELANFVGTLALLRSTLGGTGSHLGNIIRLAKPIA